jgi:hypothetical protein
MSSRFHNKFHRHNHHTTPINDPRYPDAAHDPIASPDAPFQGDFVIQGGLSASEAIVAAGGIAIENIDFIGLSAADTFITPISTSGEFLFVNVNGAPRAIRLWQYE